MSGIKDQDNIDDLRRRLYARGDHLEKREPFQLPKKKPVMDEVRTWNTPPEPKPQPEVPAAAATQTSPETTNLMPAKKRSRKYRLKLVLAAVFFFVVAVGVSSLLLLGGGNQISGENIAIELTGPFTVGGGEVMPIQVGVTNANAVPIQAATLIIEYPLGTQSSTEEGKELFIERLPLESVSSGETLNIPLRAIVFGEENAEKTISASIEYRVEGSNATFFKEADPLRFKISSSPVVLQLAANEKISSGQETEITLTVTSNAPNPLTDVLVKAEYPLGFDFSTAAPLPDAGNSTWRIGELAPEESVEIVVRGVVVGKESDELAAHFSVGVPNERDPLRLASVFTSATANFEIEQPFIDIDFKVGRSDNSVAVIEVGQQVTMSIDLENTLDDTIYDAVIEVALSGNAVSDLNVGPPKGFYDSRRNVITWDVTTVDALETIFPGDSERLTFTLSPDENITRTPQVDMVVSVRARRVSEVNVPEMLLGTAEGSIKVATEPELLSEAGYNVGSFAGFGPIPPKAEEETVYTLSLLAENGTNGLSNVEVTASLPTYVTWQGQSAGAGDIQFNETTRTLTWNVSSVAANQSALTSFQVAILPSAVQVGTIPTLMGEQRLRADDDFIGEVVRDTAPAVTTELSTEAGFQKGNGRVLAP